MRTRYEVGTLLRRHEGFILSSFNRWQVRTLMALSRCRTEAMGGHIDQCNHASCGKLHLSYNSCRNRHCPKCQGHLREKWIAQREEELLNTGYFHVVFTLPSELNPLALQKPKLVYSSLFKAMWATLKGFSSNADYLDAQLGVIAVLHTWGQNLSLHPHLHCIVPAGGWTKNGKWKKAKGKGGFLFPVKAMSNVFRAKYVALLRKAGIEDQKLFDTLFSKPWVVYAKKPFGHPRAVVEYLGRYSHKVAISNHRIQNVKDGEITFSVKNYKKGGKKESLTVDEREFIRRFALHILPKGFVRIRHYGFLSNTGKRRNLKKIQRQLGRPKVKVKKEPLLHKICPICKKGQLETVCMFKERGPPRRWRKRFKVQDTSK